MKSRYYLLTAAYCALIFWVSSITVDPEPERRIPGLDKAVHAAIYGGLAALVSIGLRRSNETVRPAIQFFVPLAFSFAYGFAEELHQIFLPWRKFDALDLIANGAGAFLAQYLICMRLWGQSFRELLSAK